MIKSILIFCALFALWCQLCASYKVKAPPVECDTCKVIMRDILHLVGTNTTTEHIEEVLEDVCSNLNRLLSPACEHILHEYELEIVKEIQTHPNNATAICFDFKLC
eukprot:TRINITY_DN7992_c0_g1_i4.p1 TRINITY_DN7992_c0_g1~~TRINITY_DN7992_c0_g1_i4.p1  ORF type:complete len:106 (-),score=12.20 TRINITY_DN7992_c0_g1_i4:33-350(-)